MKYMITFLTLAFSSLGFAASDLSVVKMQESGFEISVPKKWENVEKKKLKEPIVLSRIEKNKEASLIVMATTENKMSCKDFLSNMDHARGTKNKIAADKQAAGESVLKSTGANEVIAGEYEIQGKGPGFPVMQRSLCLKAKDQIRMVTAAFQGKKSAQYEPLIKDVFASFKFIPKAAIKAPPKK